MRLEGCRHRLERCVEFGDAGLGQQVHQVQASEYGLVLGVGNDEFVVKINRFSLGNVPLKGVHVSNFKTEKRTQLKRVKNKLRLLSEVPMRRGIGGRSKQRRD